eukprot:CAMPEP_0116856466 /NCGR_PEP_ID=MMETSP0418-20121206/19929_1 /TAXON_ID=1158023 /ORGANISM="Astrosyne radiata, Strain 13vi08-1A" /LENGTH=54 /DNA_ID=CAMNT_0004489873 /DNA_START=53 /DNA_END=214 /DNA_ORIENTATION=-
MALEEVTEENKQLNEQLVVAQEESNERYMQMKEVEKECGELELEIARSNKMQSK